MEQLAKEKEHIQAALKKTVSQFKTLDKVAKTRGGLYAKRDYHRGKERHYLPFIIPHINIEYMYFV